MPTNDNSDNNGNIVDMFTGKQLNSSELLQEGEEVIQHFLALATHFIDTTNMEKEGTVSSNMKSYIVVTVDKQGMLSMSSAGVSAQDMIGQMELAKQFIIMDHMMGNE